MKRAPRGSSPAAESSSDEVDEVWSEGSERARGLMCAAGKSSDALERSEE